MPRAIAMPGAAQRERRKKAAARACACHSLRRSQHRQLAQEERFVARASEERGSVTRCRAAFAMLLLREQAKRRASPRLAYVYGQRLLAKRLCFRHSRSFFSPPAVHAMFIYDANAERAGLRIPAAFCQPSSAVHADRLFFFFFSSFRPPSPGCAAVFARHHPPPASRTPLQPDAATSISWLEDNIAQRFELFSINGATNQPSSGLSRCLALNVGMFIELCSGISSPALRRARRVAPHITAGCRSRSYVYVQQVRSPSVLLPPAWTPTSHVLPPSPFRPTGRLHSPAIRLR